MRFRLDPKEADAPVQLPSHRVSPAAPQAPAPVTAPAATRAGGSKRKLIVAAVIALVLLGGGTGAVLYATHTGPFAYPHAYLVEGDSVPRGLRIVAVPQDISDKYGIDANPGEVNQDNLDQMASSTGQRPDKAWIEVLGTRTRQDALSIAAIQFPDTKSADTFRSTAQLRCAVGGAAVLQDGNVVVVVIVGDPSSLSYYSIVVSTIQSQVSGIHRVCG